MLLHAPIVTDRLILRAEEPQDADAIYAMNSDARVMQYIGDGRAWTSPVAEFREQFRDGLERSKSKPWGGAAVLLKETGSFIGLCWLAPSEFLGGQIELGYRYLPSHWGRGLATEAGRAIVQLGFDRLSLDVIGSAVHPNNVGSIRVLEKLGFMRRADKFHPRARCDVRVYEVISGVGGGG